MRRDFLPIIGGSFDRNSLADKEAMRSDSSEDTETVVGCAHIARHRVHGCPECRVFVTDEHGHEIAEVPLPIDSARSIRSWSWLPNFPLNFGSQSSHIVAWSMAAVAIVVLAVTTGLVANQSTYQTASAPTTSALISVRFVAQATAADIATFLETYKGTIIQEPRPGGFYRIRVSEPKLSPEELKRVAARMAEDRLVEMIAVSQ